MNDKLCHLCQNKEGKYVCPTCNILYCSLVCFKSQQHLECSEIFYKKCVEEELRYKQCPTTNMISILKRTRENFFPGPPDDDDNDNGDIDEDDNNGDIDEDDNNGDIDEDDSDDDGDSYSEDIAKRMENVDLNNCDELWEKLTVKERKQFMSLISNGGIRDMLPEWVPWWKYYKPKLITDVEAEDKDAPEDCPSIDLSVPPFSTMETCICPTENIPFVVANILMAYVCTARWFKGKHCDMPVEGVTTLIALSDSLRCNKVFNSLNESYLAFVCDSKNCKWLSQDKIMADLILEDTMDVIAGVKGQDINFSVKVCLCDIYNLLQRASEIMEDPEGLRLKRFTGPEPTLLQIKSISYNLLYYISWCSSCDKNLKSKLEQGLH